MLQLAENIVTLEQRIAAPLLGRVPFLETTDPEMIAGCLRGLR